MSKSFIQTFAALAALGGLCFQAGETLAAEAKEQAENDVEEVLVYGEPGATDTATKLDLTIFDTPQTVTAVSRVQLEDFVLDKVDLVLDYTPGVTVEEVETHRTYYTARGFDIVNFQYDGIGTPFAFGLVQGQSDTAIYEKVEVVKGAAGLITGLANPSATVNFVRKRPTDNVQASARASANEWNGYRLDGDVSGNLGNVGRGRLVVATEDTESYLDRLNDSTNVLYGIMEFDLTNQTLLTVGHSYDRNEAEGILWGALPLVYTDGSPTNYDVSTSSATDWSFRNTEENQSFVELKQQLSDSWSLNAVYTLTKTDIASELFYVSGTPEPDESGLGAYTGRYLNGVDRKMLDLYASGYFPLAGREHQLVIGYSQGEVEITGAGFINSTTGYPTLGSDWAEGNTPRPDFIETSGTSDVKQDYQAFYAASRLSITDALSALIGARKQDYKQTGVNYGANALQDADKTVPYYGLTYQLNDVWMAYGSYSEVFSSQVFVDPQLRPLGPIEGDSSEVGVKASLNNGRAVLTVAGFKAEIDNYGVFVGNDPDSGVATYEPRTQMSEGVEIELTGQLADGLNVSAGFTKVDVENASGSPVSYIPEHLIKASASYWVPAIPELKIAGVLKWQSEITTASGIGEQKDYGLLDLLFQYQISEQVKAAVNINNVTNEKYLNSLYWDQAYYGAPRNVQLSLGWEY